MSLAKVTTSRALRLGVVLIVAVALGLVATGAVLAGPNDGTGTMTVSPSSVSAGAAGQAFVFTYTAATDFTGTGSKGSSVTLTINSNWALPRAGSGTGHVTVAAPIGNCSPTISSISVWVIVVNQTCHSGDTFTITYGADSGNGVPSPTTTGTYTFAAESQFGPGGSAPIGTSPKITVTPGAAHELVFTTQPPSSVAAGSPFTVAATIRDSYHNVVTNYSGNIWVVATGITPVGGTTTVAAVNGVATFSNIHIDTVGKYGLMASNGTWDNPNTLTAISTNFTVTAGAAANLVFTTQPPSSTTAGTSFTVSVELQDAYGNSVSTSNTPIVISSKPATTITGTTTVKTTAGTSTFNNISIRTAGTYDLVASAVGLAQATSDQIDIIAGNPDKLGFVTEPSNTAAGSPITPAVAVAVQDQYGNTVTSSTASVTVAIKTNPGSGTLSGTTTLSASGGIATFNGLSINKTGTGYTLRATSSELTRAISTPFDIAAGVVSSLVFTTQPSNTTAGSPFSVAVTVRDSSGNTVTTATGSVTIDFGANPGSGTLSGAKTAALVNGVATFAGLSIDKAGTGYTLRASLPTIDATSSKFNVRAAAASQLAFTTQPANTTAGAPFGVVVTIQDANGNTVKTSGSVSLTIGMNPATGTLSGTTTVAAVNGVATFSSLSIDNAGTGYTLQATSGSLPAATSVNFNILKRIPSCIVTGIKETYTGTPYTATATCTGAGGEALTGVFSAPTHTDAGSWTDSWSFTPSNVNYAVIGDTVLDTIAKANPTCEAHAYHETYNGSSWMAGLDCYDLLHNLLSGTSDLSGTVHADAGTYSKDLWSFQPSNSNYAWIGGTVEDVIDKATATCTVNAYDVTYDGSLQTASGSCVGVLPGSLVGLELSGTAHTDADTYTDTWTFSDPDHNYLDASGTITDIIEKASVSCKVTFYVFQYDGWDHTATGHCSAPNGDSLDADLDLSATTHRAADGYPTDAWTFTDPAGNYEPQSGTVNDKIDRLPMQVTLSDGNKTYGQISTGSTIILTQDGNLQAHAGDWLDCTRTSDGFEAKAPVGSYAITCTSVTGSGVDNYVISWVAGNLTVDPALLNIKPDDQTKHQGDTWFTLGHTAFTAPGLAGWDSISSVDLSSTGALVSATQGTYEITSDNAVGSGLGNYTITYGKGTLTVGVPAVKSIAITKSSTTSALTAAGQTVPYSFTIVNTGEATLGVAQFFVVDSKIGTIPCGSATTVLVPNTSASNSAPSAGSSVTCTGTYKVAQADLDAGFVTNNAYASVSLGPDNVLQSASTSLTIKAGQTAGLDLKITSNPTTYSVAGVHITFTYTLKNTGNVTIDGLGTGAFTWPTGSVIPNSFACTGGASLAPGASASCTGTYDTTSDDVTNQRTIVTSAIVRGTYWDASTPPTADAVKPDVTVQVESSQASTTVPWAEAQASPSGTELVGGETANPSRAATAPVTSTNSGAPTGSATPLLALLICLAFGGLGLLGVTVQRRAIRR